MSPEFYVGLGIVIAVAVNAIVRHDAAQRHARYRMRAKLARWIYDGKLTPVSVRRGRRGRTAKRQPVLHAVRRDPTRTGTAPEG
jgi:hypothetical protein